MKTYSLPKPAIHVWKTAIVLIFASLQSYGQATNDSAIAIFRGGCPSDGYGVYVEKIESTEMDVFVHVKYQNPGKNCITSSAITYPNIIIKMNKTHKYIDFIVTKECN